MKTFNEKTEIESALSSISWQLKRIADSLETIEDRIVISPKLETKVDFNPTTYGESKLKKMLDELKQNKRD